MISIPEPTIRPPTVTSKPVTSVEGERCLEKAITGASAGGFEGHKAGHESLGVLVVVPFSGALQRISSESMRYTNKSKSRCGSLSGHIAAKDNMTQAFLLGLARM